MESLEKPFTDAIEAKQIEGAILTGRSKSGKSYDKCFGNRTLLNGTTKPLASSDLLFLASATKLFTAIAVLQCCEKGLLNLDTDLRSKWFKDQKIILKWDEGDAQPTCENLKNPLTLRHLLTHSSGFVYHFFNPAVKRWREANTHDNEGAGVPVHFKQPLAFQPGEGWMYGPGIDWAGHIVEDASGVKLDEYLRTHVLRPLGIAETELSFAPVKEGLGDRMPDLNPKDPKGEGLSVGNGVSVHVEGDSTCYGGQGGYATATAYVTILESILNNDGKLLAPTSVEQMFTPQLEPKAQAAFNALLKDPTGIFFGQGTTSPNRDFGLTGLLITESGDESGLGKGSLTWGGGINSVWIIEPAKGICSFAAPQLGLPVDVQKAMELKPVFRREIVNVLA